jgi:hypothetical protein
MKTLLAIVVLVGGLTLGACSKASETETPEAAASSGSTQTPAPSAEGGEEEPTLRGHMAANFKLALETREAIVDGDLATAQQKAKDLAWQKYEGVLPERWMPGVEKMQLAARNVAQATTLKEAAAHTAALAATCGECHARFETDADDSERHHGFSASGSEDIHTRMLRHQRAADGFWFGLTVPSAASWRGGARALTEAPQEPVTVEGQEVDPQLAERLEQLRELGQRALAAETTNDRVQLYGEFLADCSSCHEG